MPSSGTTVVPLAEIPVPSDSSLVDLLLARGVRILAPHATVIEDVDPERIEPGVEIFPGCTIRGHRTLLRRGVSLGRAGGGYFENVVAGAGSEIWGGVAQDCVLLDGVVIRGHAELRGGTLLEERCEAAHHVGYKMTVMMPFVVAGSLVNFCDALFCGGTSRSDHGEIGSSLALYNFTPWGDKFASLFGDVPTGVTLRAPRVFVGGQSQVVSPVHVGAGVVAAAGAAVRRGVPAGHHVTGAGSPAPSSAPFDARVYGAVAAKLRVTRLYVASLRALRLWYARVRMAAVPDGDLLQQQIYLEAMRQLDAGIAERVKRTDAFVAGVERSAAILAERDPEGARTREQQEAVERWPAERDRLLNGDVPADLSALAETAAVVARACDNGASYVDAVRNHVDDALAARAASTLAAWIDELAAAD